MLVVQHGHVSAETGLVTEDYPYTWNLRTLMRVWIDTKKGGKTLNEQQRFVSQTMDPKTGGWNKPRVGIFQGMVVVVRDDNGHVGFRSLGVYPWREHLARWVYLGLVNQLNEQEADRYAKLRAAGEMASQKHWQAFEMIKANMQQWKDCKSVDKAIGAYEEVYGDSNRVLLGAVWNELQAEDGVFVNETASGK